MKQIPKLTPDQKERFWAKVQVRATDECWPWLASTNRQGYGQFRVKCIYYVATRIAYSDSFENDPYPLLVCHTCDNPQCCNPLHLFLGTHQDNLDDQYQKGRHLVNQRPCQATKLTADNVHEIRSRLAAGELQAKIAQDFNIGQVMVSRIKTRKAWTHI